MPIPNVYGTVGEPAIATYDYIDISEGTGVREFFCTDNKSSAGTTYDLIGKPIPAVEGITVMPNDTDTVYNFDLTPFNLPKTIEGTAHFQCALKTVSSECFVKVQIKKWDGSSEVNITSEITSETCSGANTVIWVSLDLPCTITHFKKGEILRVTIKATATAVNTGHMAHSPISGTVVSDHTDIEVGTGAGKAPSTIMRALIPFRILE